MKKIFISILTIIAVVLLVNFIYINYVSDISNPNNLENLEEKSKEEIKKQMKDPSSFEFISFELDVMKTELEEIKMKENLGDLHKKGEYKYYKLRFRGRNSFGALDISEVYIKTNDNLYFLGLEE
jgi:uncharacterized protein YxeA